MHPTTTQYKYIDTVRALGGTVGQRISQPRRHRPLAEGPFDSESCEENMELRAGRAQVATSRLDYGWLKPHDEPYPEETAEVTHKLPHQMELHGVTLHYTGAPTTKQWYTDGSK